MVDGHDEIRKIYYIERRRFRPLWIVAGGMLKDFKVLYTVRLLAAHAKYHLSKEARGRDLSTDLESAEVEEGKLLGNALVKEHV